MQLMYDGLFYQNVKIYITLMDGVHYHHFWSIYTVCPGVLVKDSVDWRLRISFIKYV